MFKQLLAALVAFLGLNATAGAQTATETTARTCALPKIAAAVALKDLPGSDLMLVPVVINGTPKQFLLDIGTNATEISQQAVTELALPENPKGTELLQCGAGCNMMAPYQGPQVSIYDVRDGAGAGSLNTRVRASSFTIGTATARHMQFAVTKDVDMGRAEPYDGLLTGDFLKQYDVELDFSEKKANFLTPTDCTDPDQLIFWPHSQMTILPFTIAKDGKLQVQMMVKGHLIEGEIDTSSPYTVMRRDIAKLMLGLKADDDMVLDGDLKDGQGQPVYAHKVSQIAFPGFTASNVTVLIETYGMSRQRDREKVLGSKAQFADVRIPDFTIGMDVLRHLHLYIVYGQNKLYVTAAE